MKTISTSQLRSQTRTLVRTLVGGKSVSLTYRGHKVANIWPLKSENGVRDDDPLYRFHHWADRFAKPLNDREIDLLIYGG
jgi:antitoxin (DNA-binding transcriptional repressor) of toxin-antitoxin stability system